MISRTLAGTTHRALSAACMLLVACHTNSLVGSNVRDALPSGEDSSVELPSFDAGKSAREHRQDGGTIEPLSDAGEQTRDAAAQVITFTARQNARGLAGQRAIFHDARGAILGDRKTDSAGTAAFESPTAMVTAVLPPERGDASPSTLLTYIGVSSGDSLELALPSLEAEAVVTRYDLRWDGLPPFLTASIGDCRSGPWFLDKPTNSELVDVTRSCLDGAEMALAVDQTASDQGIGVNGFLSARPLPAPVQGVTRAQLTTRHDAQFIEVVTKPVGGRAWDSIAFASGKSYRLPLHTQVWHANAPKVAFPAALMDTISVTVGLDVTADGEWPRRQRVITRHYPAVAGVLEVDFSAALAPIATAVLRDNADGRATFAWSATGDVARADYGLLQLDLGTGPLRTWWIVFPTDTKQFTLPQLPADLKHALPRVAAVTLIDYETLTGYSEFKARGLSVSHYEGRYAAVRPDVAPDEHARQESNLHEGRLAEGS